MRRRIEEDAAETGDNLIRRPVLQLDSKALRIKAAQHLPGRAVENKCTSGRGIAQQGVRVIRGSGSDHVPRLNVQLHIRNTDVAAVKDGF